MVGVILSRTLKHLKIGLAFVQVEQTYSGVVGVVGGQEHQGNLPKSHNTRLLKNKEASVDAVGRVPKA